MYHRLYTSARNISINKSWLYKIYYIISIQSNNNRQSCKCEPTWSRLPSTYSPIHGWEFDVWQLFIDAF